MTRTLLALILTLTTASAGASTWPWEEPVSQEPPEYCKGLVIGGLVEYTRLDYTADANWAANNTEVDDVESGIGYRLEIGYHIQ